MYMVYCNETGENLFVCMSRYALDQCFDKLESQGRSCSYTTFSPEFYEFNKEIIFNTPKWMEV